MNEKLNYGLFSKYRAELYGIATLMIMMFHSQVALVYPGWFNEINMHLNYGVDIFLFLSGISLYYSFSKDSNYAGFMKKRAERTLLPYLIIGFFFWFWKYIIADFSITDFVYNISGMSLFLVKSGETLVIGQPEMWYVAFILGLYAVYPVFFSLFFGASEKHRKLSFSVILVLSVAFVLFEKYYAPEFYASTEVWLIRIPVFVLGCFSGKAAKEKKPFTVAEIILCFLFIPLKVLTMLLGSVLDSRMMFRYLGLFGALFIMFIAVFLFEKLNLKPLRKICSFFGSISLEMYMIHVMLYKVILYYIPDLRTSETYSPVRNAFVYIAILVVSLILSLLFRKIYDALIAKKKAV